MVETIVEVEIGMSIQEHALDTEATNICSASGLPVEATRGISCLFKSAAGVTVATMDVVTVAVWGSVIVDKARVVLAA